MSLLEKININKNDKFIYGNGYVYGSGCGAGSGNGYSFISGFGEG